VDVAANVCGVSVSALAASVANGQASCTAKTATPQLTQAVQQQIASGGSVTGGPQTMGGTTTNNMF
jgi:ABC-type proline/glycine betaine transport system substrate-binding protein